MRRLREQFTPRELGFSRMALYRIAPRALIATEEDFRFSFRERKFELLRHWQERAELGAFWQEPMEIAGRTFTHGAFQRATEISDDDFCELCQHVQIWVARGRRC